MQHLSRIKGPLVDDWKDDQIQDLVDKTTQAQNPVARGNKDLWMDYITAFDDTFTDTTRRQTAQAKLKHLWMKDDDLDTYISAFKHLT